MIHRYVLLYIYTYVYIHIYACFKKIKKTFQDITKGGALG
jgi:hypothetical protein